MPVSNPSSGSGSRRSLLGEVLADGTNPHPDPPCLLRPLELREAGVELIQGVDPRHRRQIVAAPVTDLALHASLLVGAAKSRLAVERSDAEPLPKVTPARMLFSRPALADHPRHSRGKVVIADLTARDPAQRAKRVNVPFQKRFLAAGSRDAVHRLARVGQPQREHEALGALAGQIDPRLAEVNLSIHTRLVVPDHEPRRGRRSGRLRYLLTTPTHVVPYRRIGDVGSELLLKTRHDPLDCVPLLRRRVQIFQQPLVDRLLERLQPR